jgi:hypothetical protein
VNFPVKLVGHFLKGVGVVVGSQDWNHVSWAYGVHDLEISPELGCLEVPFHETTFRAPLILVA